MSTQAWFTLGVIAFLLIALARKSHLADVFFLSGVVVLALAGIITPQEAVSGFANPGMLTVAALFVVASAMRDTGALDSAARLIFKPPRSERGSILRLTAPVAFMSAWLNNTTIVAMALPLTMDWCRKFRIPPSRVLIPLSYATIAGGVCTLIGTSTNLVIHGLMLDAGMKGLGFFELSAVGVPITIITLLYLLGGANWLLPRRRELLEQLGEERREYTVEMLVEASCPLIGRSIEQAGLRHLPGLFLVDITRGDDIVSPVGPHEILRAGDRLVFVGVVGTIVDLQKIKGLVPAPNTPADAARRPLRHLCEAVVSASSPMVGRGIREANFRTIYDAAIIAVHRNGARLTGKIGDIVLRAGDTLLLQTRSGFVRAHRNNPDFYLISEVGPDQPVRHDKAVFALVILIAMIVTMALPDILGDNADPNSLVARLDRGRVLIALGAAVLLVFLRCIPVAAARRSMQWDVLLVIAASFGLAIAMEKTGAANGIVDAMMPLLSKWGPTGAIVVIYLMAAVLTEILTNNAAAALVFPIALQTAHRFGVDPHPFAVTVAIAASCAFASPIGYQTHMMVFGPGGYRFGDFLKAGLPLNLIWLVGTAILVPIIYRL